MGRFSSCARAARRRRSLVAGLILSAASLLFTGNVSCSYAADPAAPHLRVSQPTSDTLALANLQDQFTTVADRVAPSVVAISASVNYIDSDDLVGELSPQRLRAALDGVTRTVGTGLVIDSDGYILTNEHVVADTEQIWITTDDHQVYPAVIVGSDPRADLAVLKVPASNLHPVNFAKPGSARRGQWTIALGNPYGLAASGEMAMSVGVVSALERSLVKLSNKEDRNYSNLIQTTAEINPGNSGGPLFDLGGEVIGISTAVILPQKQTNGIGFAIPVTDRLLEEVAALKEGREIVYAFLGVIVSTPASQQRKAAGASPNLGVIIESIEANSPAAGNLKVGDIVTDINGKLVADSDHFVDVIGACTIGEPARLSVWRDGKLSRIQITPAQRALPSVAINKMNQRFHWRGMLLGPIPANWDFGKSARPQAGLMVLEVKNNSPMTKQGIIRGSVITKVAGKTVSAISDLQSILHQTPAEQCSVQLADTEGPVAAAPAAAKD